MLVKLKGSEPWFAGFETSSSTASRWEVSTRISRPPETHHRGCPLLDNHRQVQVVRGMEVRLYEALAQDFLRDSRVHTLCLAENSSLSSFGLIHVAYNVPNPY